VAEYLATSVIVTTGNPTKSRLLDDLQAPDQGCLPKPFRAAALLEMLHQVLHPLESAQAKETKRE
jgi:CheY-like chemotaxis protein